MQWIPINRDLLTTLPTDRPYTKLEAAARITADRQDGTVRSMREYGRIFSWDSKTVKTFLDLQMIVTLTSAQKENNNSALQGDIPQSGNSALAPQSFRTDSTANINNSNELQEDIPQPFHTDSTVTPQLLSRYRFKDSLVQFEDFYKAYPKRRNRAAAERAFKKLNPSPELYGQMMEALDWQTKQPEWLKNNGQFIPLPASWLNGRRWDDERPTAADIPTTCTTDTGASADYLRKAGLIA